MQQLIENKCSNLINFQITKAGSLKSNIFVNSKNYHVYHRKPSYKNQSSVRLVSRNFVSMVDCILTLKVLCELYFLRINCITLYQ